MVDEGDIVIATMAASRLAAQVEREGNVFVVRGRLTGQRADWLRPGMSGVAKVDSPRRTLAWIATHRLIDFLRLKLWW
jgi:hypothetical protein